MSALKIMVTGASGLLGEYVTEELQKNHDVLGLYNSKKPERAKKSLKVELTNHELLTLVTEDFKPDVIIHLAAISRPDAADKLGSKITNEINVNATKRIAELCDLNNIKMIYTSTDLVYDGERGAYLTESSKLNPVSLYAETKLLGEMMIKRTFENFIILRTSLQYGYIIGKNNSGFHNMYNKLVKNEEVTLFSDQYRTPSELSDSARMIGELVEKDIKGEIFNLGGAERVSRLELGEMLCEMAKLDKSLIIIKTMDEAGVDYKVRDVSMNTEKLNSIGIKQASIEESIHKFLSYISLKK